MKENTYISKAAFDGRVMKAALLSLVILGGNILILGSCGSTTGSTPQEYHTNDIEQSSGERTISAQYKNSTGQTFSIVKAWILRHSISKIIVEDIENGVLSASGGVPPRSWEMIVFFNDGIATLTVECFYKQYNVSGYGSGYTYSALAKTTKEWVDADVNEILNEFKKLF
jgi:hypothetical protein